jgi:hypothetical protein
MARCGKFANFRKSRKDALFYYTLWMVLSSIIDTTPDDVPEEFYLIATLPINEGGLGIHMVKEVASAAFLASVLTYLQSQSLTKMLKYHELDLNRFIEKTIATLKGTWGDLEDNLVLLGFLEEDPNSLNNLQEGIKLTRELNIKESETLQNKFNMILQNKRKISMEENMKNPGRLHWWKEQQNDFSGRWLEVIPKINKYTFNSIQFKTNMRYRMSYSRIQMLM